MQRRTLVLALLVCTLVATQLDAQECTSTRVTCGTQFSGRLETSGCRFTNNPNWPFASYFVDLVSGQVFSPILESTNFQPYIALYRGNESQPVASDDGATIAFFDYDVVNSGRYRIVVAGLQNAQSGLYRLTVLCETVCRPPFAGSPTSVQNVPVGGRATITANSDGTPPMHYRWYDVTNPSVTIGGDSPTITTPPLFTNTSFYVEVTNACGKASMFAAYVTVSGTCEAVRITDVSKDQSLTRGASTTLFVTAEGTRPFTYEWFEGSPPDVSQRRGTDATLSVTNVQSRRTFWVRVTNGCGVAESGPITVDLRGRRRAVTR